MRLSYLVVLALALSVGTFMGPAVAEHNAVQVKVNAGGDTSGNGDGAPFPTPHDEPNTPEGELPVYHTALPDNEDVPATYPYFGDYARVSPADGAGVYVGEVIGYIDGVIEYQGAPAIVECADSDLIAFCQHPNDPLYPVRPAPGDDQCELPGSVNDPNCSGEGHDWRVNVYNPVGVDAPNPEPLHEGAPFVWPGVYSKYVYMFGAGSGPSVDEAPFADYLSETICHDYVEDVTGNAATADEFLPGGSVGCSLVSPDDLTNFKDNVGVLNQAGISGDKHNGRTEQAVTCSFAPQFTTLSGDSDEIVCTSISQFNEYSHECDEDASANCFNNKPGWYIATGSIDYPTPGGSMNPADQMATLDGNRSDVARTFTYYASPVPVTSSNWCAAPPVQTTAADGLETGVQKDTSTQDPDDWTVPSSSPQYLLGAHDIDQHRSADPFVTVDQTINTAVDTANEVLDSVPGINVPDTSEIEDQAFNQVDRADPTVGSTSEPNAAGDTTATLTRDIGTTNCPGAATTSLQETSSAQTTSVGRIQAGLSSVAAGTVLGEGFGGGTMHDYTLLDEDLPVPEESDEQRQNPWSPDQYSFGGALMVYEDRNENLTFDGCPNGQVPTTASPDICQVELPWDAYNPNAALDTDRTVADFAKEQKFADPLGLVSVVKTTGPIAVDSLDDADMTENPPDSAVSNVEDRWTVLPGTGQKCIVGFSQGLLDANSDVNEANGTAGPRVRQVLGLSAGASAQDVGDELCGGSADHVMTDAFTDQTTLGDFGAGFNWVKLQPTPSVSAGADDDGLTVHAFLTVEDGGDEKTAANLALGQDANGDSDITNDPTVAEEWSDGSVTYQWTDHDPFRTERT